MDFDSLIGRLALGAGLGLLVGLQRERESRLAGLRTFSLITLFGFLCGLLSATLGGWPFGLGVVAIAILLTAGNYFARAEAESDPGITTEVAALMMFGIGAYLAVGDVTIAVALGATVAALLAFKVEIHTVAQRLTERDVKAIMQFALLSLVILPALPDRAFGPYNVVNPRQVWWMVVLIVGVGLSGYVAHKFVSASAGVTMNGLLGGAVSSTATTASYARNVATGAALPTTAAAVILIASAVAVVRILLELAVTSPALLWAALPGVAIQLVPLLGGALYFLRRNGQSSPYRVLSNPSQLGSALFFAGLYAAALVATAAVNEHLGSGALFWLAIVSGLTDVDAITLSSARLVSTGVIDTTHGGHIVVTAAAANLVGKAAFAALLGNRELVARIAVPFALSALAAAGLVWFL
ncbi:MAG: MgtC/SapB family protein [Bryobacterales bacterium]|nr:MgtC/SapB family protein [Bryobacterales bacterium]